MTDALTETVWIKTLRQIVNTTGDETTRTLAAMLYEIIHRPDEIAEILDTYGSHLMEDRV